MSMISTFTGKRLNPLEPKKETIDIRDIAHALSLLCRGNGQVSHFYSVAQHSIACSKEAEARGYSKRIQYACLLHDASEAYLSDVTRPVKRKMPEYMDAEAVLQREIWGKYFQQPLTENELAAVREIDDDMLFIELEQLLHRTLEGERPQMYSEFSLAFRDMAEVEKKFLEMHMKLNEA